MFEAYQPNQYPSLVINDLVYLIPIMNSKAQDNHVFIQIVFINGSILSHSPILGYHFESVAPKLLYSQNHILHRRRKLHTLMHVSAHLIVCHLTHFFNTTESAFALSDGTCCLCIFCTEQVRRSDYRTLIQ